MEFLQGANLRVIFLFWNVWKFAAVTIGKHKTGFWRNRNYTGFCYYKSQHQKETNKIFLTLLFEYKCFSILFVDKFSLSIYFYLNFIKDIVRNNKDEILFNECKVSTVLCYTWRYNLDFWFRSFYSLSFWPTHNLLVSFTWITAIFGSFGFAYEIRNYNS